MVSADASSQIDRPGSHLTPSGSGSCADSVQKKDPGDRISPLEGIDSPRPVTEFPQALRQSQVPDGRPTAGVSAVSAVSAARFDHGKRWWLKLWSPVEGHPKKAERCAWRRSSARECRQAYATTLLSSVKGHVARRAEKDNSFVPHRPGETGSMHCMRRPRGLRRPLRQLRLLRHLADRQRRAA